jgi:lipopolysaccharide transport protein LptA
MKLIPVIFSALTATAVLAAQTNLPPATVGATETHINSNTVDFDLKTRTAVYRGNVHVEDERINMTCEVMTAKLPASGGRVDSIIAETNVVILVPEKGVTNRATSQRAVYTFNVNAGVTNETLELTGSPALDSPQGRLTGDKITWDRVANTIRATNQRMLVRTEATNSTPSAATNTAATNAGALNPASAGIVPATNATDTNAIPAKP